MLHNKYRLAYYISYPTALFLKTMHLKLRKKNIIFRAYAHVDYFEISFSYFELYT